MNLCNSFCSSKKPEVPKILQIYLTNNYLYGMIQQLLVFAISSFIDNIASTMIGGIYLETFKGKVHIVYVA